MNLEELSKYEEINDMDSNKDQPAIEYILVELYHNRDILAIDALVTWPDRPEDNQNENKHIRRTTPARRTK